MQETDFEKTKENTLTKALITKLHIISTDNKNSIKNMEFPGCC